MTVRRKDGSLVKDVHSENVVVVPDSVKDLERPDLTFEDEDDPLVVQDLYRRRSPGMMMDDGGEEVRRQEGPGKGKLDKIPVAGYIAYQTFKTFMVL